MIRVRFAPSPTGYLHVGSARTAYFNWLFAQNRNGKFVLRIEDTDEKRSKKEYSQAILDSLDWLGISYDELYYQSDRLDIYHQYVEELQNRGVAYRCYCTDEELSSRRRQAMSDGRPPGYDGRCRDLSVEERRELEEQGRSPAIRFRLPDDLGSMSFIDEVRGEVEFGRVMTGDFVVERADGYPSYNFACVVDDHLMKMTHVLRGEDHLSNTPKQILLYQALGWKPPAFGHFSMLLGSDRSRLSKRHGSTSVEEFRNQGIVAEALKNHLVLCGWSPKEQREIFSEKELIDKFSLTGIVTSSQVFDMDKLKWMNGKYIRSMPDDEYEALVSMFVSDDVQEKLGEGRYRAVLTLLRDSISMFSELADNADLRLFLEKPKITHQAQETLAGDATVQILQDLAAMLREHEQINPKQVTTLIRKVKKERNVSFPVVYKPLRAAVTGRLSGPEINDVISILGPEETATRIDLALQVRP